MKTEIYYQIGKETTSSSNEKAALKWNQIQNRE